MPRKISFRVDSVTSEDDDHQASELNQHGPTVKGWLSKKYCNYPQEVVVRMESKCRICRIQILSHQFCIPSAMDIYVGSIGAKSLDMSLQSAKWHHLGEITLADNIHSEYKSRELKSVLVDAVGEFVKLLVHGCHVNKHNVYNQVGIIALNIIGDDDPLVKTSDPGANWQSIIKRNEEISPMDDLAFDMYVDGEVAQILRKLEHKKRDAINEERFIFAKKLKHAIGELQKVGERLAKMMIDKQTAVETEDFDRARRIKDDMQTYRMNAYEHLRLPELMEMEGYNPERDSVVPGPVPSPEKGVSTVTAGGQQQINMTTTTHYSKNINGSKDMNMSKPQDRKVVYQSRLPKPTPSTGLSQFALESRLLSSSRATADDVEEFDKDLVLGGMSLKDRQEASLPIEVFGLRMVQKLYSRNFIQREDAFKEMLRVVDRYNARRSRHSPEEVLRASVFLLQRGFRDKVLSVFIQALNVMQALFTRFTIIQRTARVDTTLAINKLVPRILFRLGDAAAPRLKSVAQEFLLEMVDYEDHKTVQSVLGLILKPFTDTTNPRLAQGRAELVDQLITRVPPLSDTDPLFTQVMNFAIRALSHPAIQVREVAEQILLSLYRLIGTPVRQCLVPESVRLQRNFTYRKVFEEFEKIDREPTTLSATRPPRRARSASVEPPATGHGGVLGSSSQSLSTGDVSVVGTGPQDGVHFDLDRMCMFCEETNERFNAETLNYHYWTECPMLMLCPNCKQVVEIGGLTRHLLDECSHRSQYKLCIRCKEAIPKNRFEGHVKLRTCIPAKPPNQANHCPLCHQNFPPGEEAWKVHLMSEMGCPFNPRRRHKLFRWRSGSIFDDEPGDGMAGRLKILGALPPEYRQYALQHRSKSEPPNQRSANSLKGESNKSVSST
ncbi:centrosomal protein of 104 kDa-like [Varroa jacobsoni]|uniref:TOG domain-containing protein n=1 Tax=Varroa destructor TaxID=109461 RepID=A0A7M7KN13_VARDE|nr:centrosomal protein of 104 kDa-like [Varroa destructor]XP_022705579.1 centrosomal protein of 104 kDa-like [Varroa jacobsoni]